MKRAPIVLSGTAFGLVGVLSYHVTAPSSTIAIAGTARTTTTAKTAPASSSAKSSTTSAPSTASATRSATGEDVQFQYGDLQVKVTMSGTKISDVSLVQVNETDPHSQEIDQSAIPQLRQEALAAGSAKIDGVSGASYTTAAYEQSLQSALDKLGTSASA